MKNLILVLLLLVPLKILAIYTVPQEQVNGIETEKAVQIAEQALTELNYKISGFDAEKKTVQTDWITWNSIGISNRAKLQITATNNNVLISMIDRQYKTSEGWSVTPTKLSKKNHKKYLLMLAEKIKSIANNKELALKAVYNSRLILAFRPYLELNGLRVDFIKGVKNMESEGLKTPNLFLELKITNTLDMPVEIRCLQNIDFINGKKVLGEASCTVDEMITMHLHKHTDYMKLAAKESKKYYVYFTPHINKTEAFKISKSIGTIILPIQGKKLGQLKFTNHNVPTTF